MKEPAIHVGGRFAIPITVTGLGALVAVITFAVIASKNAGDALAATNDHTPRVIILEQKITNIERDVQDIKVYVMELLTRIPKKD